MKSVTVPVLVKSLVCRRLVMIFRLRLVIASKGRLGVSFRVLSASIFETIDDEMSFARRGTRRVPMHDVDLPKAEHVLSVLRRARLSRNETAWIEISALSASLREKLYAPPDMWNAALKSTERWKELLS